MAKVDARNEAKLAAAKTAPVFVFISRKTQRVYVRQALQPVLESSLTIHDPDEPIGTTIFTALEYTNEGTDVRWNALSMYANADNTEPSPSADSRRRANRDTAPAATSSEVAVADRLSYNRYWRYRRCAQSLHPHNLRCEVTGARGLAPGTVSHGIATARAFNECEISGCWASLAMALNALLKACWCRASWSRWACWAGMGMEQS